MTHRLVLVLGIVGVLAFVGFGTALIPLASNPAEAGDRPDLERGATVYAEACAACHGRALEGQANWRQRGSDGRLPAPPHDVSGHTWHHPDRILLEITLHGSAAVVGGGYQSNMPGFGDRYSEDELRDVLEWIKTHWPERARQYQAGQLAIRGNDLRAFPGHGQCGSGTNTLFCRSHQADFAVESCHRLYSRRISSFRA